MLQSFQLMAPRTPALCRGRSTCGSRGGRRPSSRVSLWCAWRCRVQTTWRRPRAAMLQHELAQRQDERALVTWRRARAPDRSASQRTCAAWLRLQRSRSSLALASACACCTLASARARWHLAWQRGQGLVGSRCGSWSPRQTLASLQSPPRFWAGRDLPLAPPQPRPQALCLWPHAATCLLLTGLLLVEGRRLGPARLQSAPPTAVRQSPLVTAAGRISRTW